MHARSFSPNHSRGDSDAFAECGARTHRAGGVSLPYRLLTPKAEPDQRYPLVLFLHGAGERGADNRNQLTHGVRPLLDIQERFPCFVAFPQCPEGRQWVNVPWAGGSYSTERVKESEELRAAIDLVRALQTEFPDAIDPGRLYVMGLSMGGYGTWDAAVRHPGLFAAAVPVCGGGDPSKADAIRRLPLWAFHGDRDTVVPPAASRDMIEALTKVGAKHARYTEYPGVGHDSWNKAWAEPGLWEWLFAQKR